MRPTQSATRPAVRPAQQSATRSANQKGQQPPNNARQQPNRPPPRPRGVTVRQLLTMGRRYWGRNSQWVKLMRPRKAGGPDAQTSIAVVTYSSHDNWGIRKRPNEILRYLTTVVSMDNPGIPLHKARAVKVSCQCKSHKYGCEFKLHKLGAADLVHSNGRPPVTYMVNIPSVCKHVYKVCLEVVRRGL